MPYLKNNNAFFDISLGFLLLYSYWPGFAKATLLICLSFSNYIYRVSTTKPGHRHITHIKIIYAMPMSTSSNISLDENDSFFEFKYPQDSRFRLRTTHWKISDKDLTDAGSSNVNINLDEKFGNVKKCHNKIYEDKLVFQCEECNRNFKNEKGLKIHRTRIHGLMGQSFLCESFSSKIDKTRKNEKIHQTPPTSMDYEKQSGSEDSQPDGSQRLRCTLCPGKSFKDNNRLKIHVDKYHVDNNLSTSSTSSSTDSITKLLINLKLQLPIIRRIPKACRHLAADKLSSIINNCFRPNHCHPLRIFCFFRIELSM
jgi:hypothetical protein